MGLFMSISGQLQWHIFGGEPARVTDLARFAELISSCVLILETGCLTKTNHWSDRYK